MNFKKYILICISLMLFCSCDGYLDLVPEDDILTVEAIFEKENTMNIFYVDCHKDLDKLCGGIRSDFAVAGADEYISNELPRNSALGESVHLHVPVDVDALNIASGKNNPSQPIMPYWNIENRASRDKFSLYFNIYYCNIFLENIDKVYNLDGRKRERYRAEIKALKAYYYWNLIRAYGPIVLKPKTIPENAPLEEMKIVRSHVDTCFNRVVELLDEAIPFLDSYSNVENWRITCMNKEMALALKAKVRVYQASPLFNGNEWYANFKNREGEPLFSGEYDHEKWKVAAEACDEALVLAEGNGFHLVKSSASESSLLLNTIHDLKEAPLVYNFSSPESLWAQAKVSMDDILLKSWRTNYKHPEHCYFILGNLNPTMRMVEMYYTENGLPIDKDRTWDYNNRYKNDMEKRSKYKDVVELGVPVLKLHLKREPRFYANISADHCYWMRGYERKTPKPYKGDVNGFDGDILKPNSIVNMTGYWCKKYVGDQYGYSMYSSFYPVYSKSAMRLADLYLLQAEAWNEYNGPSQKVYDAINIVRDRAGIPDLSESWSQYSTEPGKFRNQDGLREIIRQERSIEMAFDGERYFDIRRWKIAHILMNKPIKGWNIMGETMEEFYNHYNGPISVYTNKFEYPRDYFMPILDKEILNSNIVQNLGW